MKRRPARKPAPPARRPAPAPRPVAPPVRALAEPRPELRVVRDDEAPAPPDVAALRRLLARVVALAEDLTGRTIADPTAAVVALELHLGRPR